MCFCNYSATSADLIFGAHNIDRAELTQVLITVTRSEIEIHPQWNPLNIADGYDIAVINLNENDELQFNNYIQPIALPARSDAEKDWSDFSGIASGWGFVGDRETSISSVMNFVKAEIKSNDACNTWWFETIKSNMICGSGENGKNSFWDSSNLILTHLGTL